MVAACKRGAAFTRGRLNSVSGLPAIYRTGDHSKAFLAATLLLTMTLLMLALSAIAGESLLNVSRWQIRALSEWPALIEAGLPAGDRRERYTAILLCGAGAGAGAGAELRRCTAQLMILPARR